MIKNNQLKLTTKQMQVIATNKVLFNATINKINNHKKEDGKLDSGLKGDAFELQVKSIFGIYENYIKGESKADLIKYIDGRRTRFEIKSGNGEIGKYNSNGKLKGGMLSCKYIIICPTVDLEASVTEYGYVVDKDLFLNFIYTNGFYREQTGTNGEYKRNLRYIESKKRVNQVIEFLENNGYYIQEFMEKFNIKNGYEFNQL